MFDNPPEPEPIQEAPVTGQPPRPPAPTGNQSPELVALFGAMALPHAQVSEFQVMNFCHQNKLATPQQRHLSELSTQKLVNLTNAISKPTSPILAKIKEIAIDV
jgi:hypothetical protein